MKRSRACRRPEAPQPPGPPSGPCVYELCVSCSSYSLVYSDLTKTPLILFFTSQDCPPPAPPLDALQYFGVLRFVLFCSLPLKAVTPFPSPKSLSCLVGGSPPLSFPCLLLAHKVKYIFLGQRLYHCTDICWFPLGPPAPFEFLLSLAMRTLQDPVCWTLLIFFFCYSYLYKK